MILRSVDDPPAVLDGRPAKRVAPAKHVTFADPIATVLEPADRVTLHREVDSDSLLIEIASSSGTLQAHLLDACRAHLLNEDIMPHKRAIAYTKLHAKVLRNELTATPNQSELLFDCGTALLARNDLLIPLRAQVAHNMLTALQRCESNANAQRIRSILPRALDAAAFMPIGANAHTLQVEYLSNLIRAATVTRTRLDQIAASGLINLTLTILKSYGTQSPPLHGLLIKTMVGSYNHTLNLQPWQHESLLSIAGVHLAHIQQAAAPIEARAHFAANLIAHMNRFTPPFAENERQAVVSRCFDIVNEPDGRVPVKARLVANLAVGSLLKYIRPDRAQVARLTNACFEILAAQETMSHERYLINCTLVTATAKNHLKLSQDHGKALIEQSILSLRDHTQGIVNTSHLTKCLLEAFALRHLQPSKAQADEISAHARVSLNRPEVPVQTKLVIIANVARLNVNRDYLLDANVRTQLAGEILALLPTGPVLNMAHLMATKLIAQLAPIECLPFTETQIATLTQAAHRCCSNENVSPNIKKEIAAALTAGINSGRIPLLAVQQPLVKYLAEVASS